VMPNGFRVSFMVPITQFAVNRILRFAF